jgi:general secretion pathway protein D
MNLRWLQPQPPRRRCCALAAIALSAFWWTAAAGEEPLQLSPAAPAAATNVPADLSAVPPAPVPDQGLAVPEANAGAATAPSPTTGGPRPTPIEGKAPPRATDLATALARRGDLTLRNSSLDGALFTISELWGINIVVGDVKGTVNGVFKDAPLREILDSILLSNGYSYRPVGESLVVSPLSELGQINPFYVSATIPVHTADVAEVMEGARLLSTPQGQVQAIKSARSLFVLDFPDRVQMIRDFVASVDGASQGDLRAGAGTGQPLEVGYFHTQYIEAKAASDALQAVLSKDGRVGVMEKEDRLVVSDYVENLKMVEQVLKRIDRPRPQVRISALIYDLSLQDIENLGFNWDGAATKEPASGTEQSLLRVDSTFLTRGGTGKPFTFMSLSPDFDITAVILALQNANDARLLADPHVAVLDNEEAEFRSVSEIPYQQLTQTGTGPPIGTTAFKNAGISLRVRPKIAIDGTIRMAVVPEYSRLTGYTPGDNQPIIDSRVASTTLTVANRQVVVIGGLRERRDVGDFQAIPYLKDIRWAGKLFRSRETDVRESELVVFIMPEIIGYDDRPNERQQAIINTSDYRLGRVPEAEGYPQGCSGCIGCAPMAGPQAMPDDSILPVPGPVGPEANTSPAGRLPASRSTDRLSVPEVQFGTAASDRQTQSPTAQGRLRRLPSVDGSQPPPFVASRAAELFGSPPTPTDPLRPDYDARFRATGDDRAEQGVTKPLPAAPQPAPKDESLWDRVRR